MIYYFCNYLSYDRTKSKKEKKIMAMEIKTMDVANQDEENIIRYWTQFGWNLKSSQRVYNKDSHLESSGDKTYSVTETVDYTRLVFERDKNGPHYAEIVRFENEYHALKPQLDSETGKMNTIQNDWNRKEKKLDFRPPANKWIIRLLTLGFLAVGILFVVKKIFVLAPIALIAIFITQGIKKSSKKKALKKAIAEPDSKNGVVYLKKYNDFMTKKDFFAIKERVENYTNRIDEIIQGLDAII